jgi:hypothetical protein
VGSSQPCGILKLFVVSCGLDYFLLTENSALRDLGIIIIGCPHVLSSHGGGEGQPDRFSTPLFDGNYTVTGS